MTEKEWLASTDPMAMLKTASCRFQRRKLRLFAVACCRRISPLHSDERSKRAIDIAERYAEGDASDADLRAAEEEAQAAHRHAFERFGKTGACLEWAAAYVAHPVAFKAAQAVSWMAATPREPSGLTGAEYPFQAGLVREIFLNHCRQMSLDSDWVTPNALKLAYSIYRDRNFDQMPLLAEALEKADQPNPDILAHCRQTDEHVLGCWVLDSLTLRELFGDRWVERHRR
jgi:hypothetical protein